MAETIRISGVVLPPEKHLVIALRAVFGIGSSRAKKICELSGYNPATKVKNLPEGAAATIQAIINENYRVEGDLRREVILAIKGLIEIRCYRGIRHKLGLPVRGQRTKTNARTRRKGKSKGKELSKAS